MKLSILIPHYKEKESVIKELLDSIYIQQYVNWQDVEIIIGNDGKDLILTSSFLKKYSSKFNLKYLRFNHEGVSGTRNKLLNAAEGEFVMFCDSDDMFADIMSLSMYLGVIENNKQVDVIKSPIYCSSITPKTNTVTYSIIPSSEGTFLHSKCYRRKFLIDNEFKFKVGITMNEDSIFNGVVFASTKNIVNLSIPTYLYKGKLKVTREDFDKSLLYMSVLIQGADERIQALIKHNREDEVPLSVYEKVYQLWLMQYAYFDGWFDKAYAEIRKHNINSLRTFYHKYKEYYEKCTEDMRNTMRELLEKKHPKTIYEKTITYEQFLEQLEKEI